MIIRRYESTDFEEMASWGKSWGAHYIENFFPKTGFIVPGVAAYFLYGTDSKVCYLENLISNPEASSEDRQIALAVLTEALIREAKRQGFGVAYACTNNGNVVDRAIRLGATFKPKYVLLTKDLS